MSEDLIQPLVTIGQSSISSAAEKLNQLRELAKSQRPNLTESQGYQALKDTLTNSVSYPARKIVTISPLQEFILFRNGFRLLIPELRRSINKFKRPPGLKKDEVKVHKVKVPRFDPKTKKKYFLDGYFLQPKNSKADTTVILGHGRNSSVIEFDKSITDIIRSGKNVFISSYSGFANNKGKISRQNLIEDFTAIINKTKDLNEKTNTSNLELVLHSLGTGIGSKALLKSNTAVNSLIVGSPFTSLRDVANDLPKHPGYQSSTTQKWILSLMGHGLKWTMDGRSAQNKRRGEDPYDWQTLKNLKELLEKGLIKNELRIVSGGLDYWVPPHQHAKVFLGAGKKAQELKDQGQETAKVTMVYDYGKGHTDIVLHDNKATNIIEYGDKDSYSHNPNIAQVLNERL